MRAACLLRGGRGGAEGLGTVGGSWRQGCEPRGAVGANTRTQTHTSSAQTGTPRAGTEAEAGSFMQKLRVIGTEAVFTALYVTASK